jgi:hypothetical protein
MLASAYPALDRPMILFQNIVEILYGAVLAILRKGTFGFEPDDRGWVSGVLVGVNNARLGMVRTSQSFGSGSALLSAASCLAERGESRSSHRKSPQHDTGSATCP